MILDFKTRYLSIDGLVRTELPNFTVLTGVNGSGKSHLLQAIQQGFVTIEGINPQQIVHFNYETFRLENEGAFNAHQLTQERESAWSFYQQNIMNPVAQWRNELGEEYPTLRTKCEESKKPLLSLRTKNLTRYRKNIGNLFGNKKWKNNEQAQGIRSLINSIPFSADELDHDEFVQRYRPFALKNDFLPHQLGKVFWDYYVKYRGNQVNEFQNEKYGKSYQVVSEEKFFEIHGEPPWDLVNRILATFDSLKYRVTSPEGSDYFGNFQLKLRHTEKDIEVDFGHLSSGERILMALVASVYKSSSDRSFPELLLLDEVDASLHPSMMKNMLDVIKSVFLDQDVQVILVSHSPTTIALAPEESIYLMNPSGQNRLVRSNRSEALEILTEGFATLEQGLRLFDEVARSELTIVTEGRNTVLIRAALRHLGVNNVNNVDILDGVENITGKNQLSTLFQFFKSTPHKNKLLFVWDCDVNHNQTADNNTFPFSLPKNPNNGLAEKGIENAFSEDLLESYVKTISRPNGEIIRQFDETCKREFEQSILERDNPTDFNYFECLTAEIERIKNA